LPGPGSNPYDVLKVPRDASVEAIEDAYDRLFDRYEPQAQAGDQAAIERLNTLNAARDTLIDPRNRAALDKTLSQAQATGGRPVRSAQGRAPAERAMVQSPKLRTQNSELRTRGTIKARPRSRYIETRPQRSLASMIPFFIIIAFLLFALAIAVTYLLNNGSPVVTTAGDSSTVVATVNGQPIYQDDYNDQVNKDKTNALNDPMFGALFNNFQGITGTRALDELEFDSLDKLINMQVIVQEAKKEGNYPTESMIDTMVQQAQQGDLQAGQTFTSFLQQHNLTADRYRRAVTDNVVYEVMANEHVPKTGTADEKSQGFVDWICTTRKNYDVKILIKFAVTDNPSCTSGLPSDLPLPGVDQTQVPGPEATTGADVTPGVQPTQQATPQATTKAP
jgi:hypothetical protein